MTELRAKIADAIRQAAMYNPHCSIVPGPFVAGIYADAVLKVIQAAYCNRCGIPHSEGECKRD